MNTGKAGKDRERVTGSVHTNYSGSKHEYAPAAGDDVEADKSAARLLATYEQWVHSYQNTGKNENAPMRHHMPASTSMKRPVINQMQAM